MYGRIKRAGNRLIRKTGIDFNVYRDQSLVESIGKATCTMVTPLTLITSIGKPLVITVAIFNVLALAFITLAGANGYGTMLILIPGNVGSLAIGFSLGVMATAKRFLNGTTQMLNNSLAIGKKVVKDMADKGGSGYPTASLSEIIQGVSYVAIAPCIEKAIKKQLGIFSIPVLVLTETGLLLSTKYLSIAAEAFMDKLVVVDEETIPGGAGRLAKLNQFTETLNEASQLMANTFACVIPKMLFPARAVLTLAACFEVILFFVVFRHFLA